MDRVRFTELSSAILSFDLLDTNGAGVPASSLTAATLTLYDLDTFVRGVSPAVGILNGRDQQDVLNTNNVAISDGSPAGHVVWSVQPDDNVIVTERRQVERHRAMFHFAWTSGAFDYECEIEVVNLRSAV